MKQTDIKPVSKQTLYQIASRHSRKAIDRIVELMDSKNENVALGACKTLLNKSIPDLKATKLSTTDDIRVNVVYFPEKKPLTKNL